MLQIWAIDPDSPPGVYVLLPNAKLIPPSAPAAVRSPLAERRCNMYTLIIEGTLKAGKKEEFKTAWGNEILPTLKKQAGCAFA